MDKAALKEHMLSLEQAELAHAIEHYEAFLRGARLDRTESHDDAEISQAEFSGEMAKAFDQPVQSHFDKLSRLRQVDFAPRMDVGEGAVVRLGDRWFVIAVATAGFTFEGRSMMGLSPDAPLVKAVAGCVAGDEITFRGHPIVVAEVL